MPIFVRCNRCGKTLKVPPEGEGKRVRCRDCGSEITLSSGSNSTKSKSGVPPVPPRPAATAENTLSRSMLPIRATAAPPDEMVCRLAPRTLRWVNATAAVQEFLGCTIDVLRQRTFPEFLHPEDRALAEDEFRQAGEIGERHDFVLRIYAESGQLHYVRIYVQARYNPDGAINHIRCYLKDVSDSVRAEQELRRRTEQLTAVNERLRLINEKLKETQGQLVHSEKLAALGTLAAGMAHEINNPLAFATNNVAVLERDIGGLLRIIAGYQEGWGDLREANPEVAARIAQLQDEVDLPFLQQNLLRLTQGTRKGLGRVAKIVQDLRDFAQLDRAEIEEIDLNQAIDQTLGMLNDALAQQGITVERRQEPLPPLECAAAHLKQVFLNLLMNAMQAIKVANRPSGRIRVTTRRIGDEVVVEIRDNGCGIPADVLPKIFDPFFTSKPVGQGTGLGLSISHGIIKEHGGRIAVESTVGAGTCLRISLPLRRPEPHPDSGDV